MQWAYEQEIEYKPDECFFVITQHTKELVNVHQFVKNYFESKGYNVHTAIYEKQTEFMVEDRKKELKFTLS